MQPNAQEFPRATDKRTDGRTDREGEGERGGRDSTLISLFIKCIRGLKIICFVLMKIHLVYMRNLEYFSWLPELFSGLHSYFYVDISLKSLSLLYF